jgi:hypothetical protein
VNSPHEDAYIESMGLQRILTATDCWSFKPAIMSLMAVAALVLLCQIPGSLSFLLIPLSLLAYGIGLILILLIAVYCVTKKRPRRGFSVLLALLLPELLWRPLNWSADLVHLGLTAGFGAGPLASSRSSDGNFVAYDWSVGLAGGRNTFLIHDVSDEIALPLAQHMYPLSSEMGVGEECAGRVQRLIPSAAFEYSEAWYGQQRSNKTIIGKLHALHERW